MFIESITLSGILSATNVKKREFKFHGDNLSENEEDFVNTIDDMEFIYGFSLIFDPSYDDKFNYKEFINAASKQEPFVEIKLWQSDTDRESNYKWLLKNELILKRNLKHPETLLVNSKKTHMSEFHEAVVNLGFISIESISIHRLLDVEVSKLGCLVGDDLWSMLMKIIACEELIEMMERKKGVIKRRALKRTYNNLADKVVQILPKKTKLYKDIQTQLTLQNYFFGLLDIIQERHNVLLVYQIGNLDDCLNPLDAQIKAKYFERHKKEKDFTSICQQRANIRVLRGHVEKVQNNADKLISEISQYTPPSIYLEDFLSIFEDINESTNVDFSDCDNSLELLGWKLLLKDSETEEDIMMFSSLIEVAKDVQIITNDYERTIEHDITALEDKIESSNSTVFLNEIEYLLTVEKKCTINYLKAEEEIIKYRSNVAETLERITETIFDAQMTTKFKGDLITIEELSRFEPYLGENYLGPLFKFLDSSAVEPNFSCKLWPQLMAATNLILFKTAAAAESFSYTFYECKANASCTFIGIDKFVENITKNQDLDSHSSISAITLIKKDTEEPLKSALVHILSNYIVTDEKEWNDDTPDQWNVTVYNDTISTIYHEGSTAVKSQLANSIWSKLKTNPIKVLEDFYALMEQRNKILDKIKTEENIRETAFDELKKETISVYDRITKRKSRKIIDTVLRSMLLLHKNLLINNNQNLEQFEMLKDSFATDLDSWDVEELQNELAKNENIKSLRCATSLSNRDCAISIKILQAFISNHQVNTPPLFEDVNDGFYKTKGKALKEKQRLYRKFHENLNSSIEQMYQISIDLLDKSNFDLTNANNSMQDQELNSQFGYIYSQKRLIESLMKDMQSSINTNIVTKAKREIFNRYNVESDDVVIEKIAEVHADYFKEKNEKHLRLNNLTPESYIKLKESIDKVPKFANEDVFIPLEVKKRAYPLMNFLVVKMLRDTVHHFKVSYNLIFSEYLSQSSLFFYTHGEINEELEEDKFSWSCFDMTRLKSLDFVDKWDAGQKSKVGLENIKQIKALLLILHMINYISIFKFIIVSSKIFEDLNPALESKIRSFLKTISTYVQIIIIEENRCETEPMDTN